MNFADEVKGQKVLVFGLGLQGGGLGDVQWLAKHGADIRVTDQKSTSDLASAMKELPAGVEVAVGGHKQEDVEWADIIIKNPGVPDNHPLLIHARATHKPVLTSIALLVREARDKVIGVTGTRGKSTTTELIYLLLDSVYPGQVLRGGNIPGTSGLALLDTVETAKYAVLELSSFQLHNFHELKVSPHIAVVTNLYPDHLNRYNSMEDYAQDKAAIAAYQRSNDYVIENGNNQGSQLIAHGSQGQHRQFSTQDVPTDWKVKIPGDHNRENIAALIAVAQALNISIDRVKNIIENFHGIPFRLENRGTVNGVTYINDTTSTTPTATLKAIDAMRAPTVLIIGGPTKNLPIDEMVARIAGADHIKKCVILGSDSNTEFLLKIQEACKDKIVGQVYNMTDAVKLATHYANKNEIVLLSPGFFSFDLFQNEFDRGRQFNECVEALRS